jgi:hypothetical protein
MKDKGHKIIGLVEKLDSEYAYIKVEDEDFYNKLEVNQILLIDSPRQDFEQVCVIMETAPKLKLKLRGCLNKEGKYHPFMDTMTNKQNLPIIGAACYQTKDDKTSKFLERVHRMIDEYRYQQSKEQ